VKNATRFRPAMERLEEREVPAFLAPIGSPGGGDSIAVGDLNSDGRDDVAVINGKVVIVSLSNGDGTFQASSTLTEARHELIHLRAADFNGDGNLDISASWYKRNGKPTDFWGVPSYPVTAFTTDWLGNGDGTFGSVSKTSWQSFLFGWPASASNPSYVNADFNRDGITDAATLASGGGVNVWLHNTDGTSQPPRIFAAGPNPGSIAVGDFNGDGWMDIVVVNNLSSSSPTLSVLLNDGIW
jgi:hypothetical protein